MVYRRKGRRSFFVAVPTRSGWIKRSTGTSDRATAKAIHRMVEELGPQGARAWDLLDAVADSRLSLGELFDAYRSNGLDSLRSRMADVDLAGYVDGWVLWLGDRVRPDTAEHYLAHVRTLVMEGMPFYRSQLTKGAVSSWLANRAALVQKRRPSVRKSKRKQDPAPRPVSGSTKLKYLAAIRSFVTFLVDRGVLSADPTIGLARPKAAPPRCLFHELPDVVRLVEGSPQPWRALYALAYGAGIEQGALLGLVEPDFDLTRNAVRTRGTKAHARDRIAYVADWAWPHVADWLAKLTPGERVFRSIDRWQVQEHHRGRQRALGLALLRFHDARHHWAVENLRAGVPVELVSRQLGHADGVMVLRVYGRFIPHDVEWGHWREQLAARQKEKLARHGTQGGTPPSANTAPRNEESPASPRDDEASGSSWGRIRTADPGIMSAVL
jgi:integrase